jgi:hypothetical protein
MAPAVPPPIVGAQPTAPAAEAASGAPDEAEPTVEFEMRAPASEAFSTEDIPAGAPAAPMSVEPEASVAPATPLSSDSDVSAAAADADKDFDVVPVFFGTDREIEADPKRLVYNAERGRRLELGRAIVTVPKSHEVPMIERPWAIRIPYFDVTIYEEDEDPKEHFTIKEIKALTREEFLRLARERLAKSARFKDHAIHRLTTQSIAPLRSPMT